MKAPARQAQYHAVRHSGVGRGGANIRHLHSDRQGWRNMIAGGEGHPYGLAIHDRPILCVEQQPDVLERLLSRSELVDMDCRPGCGACCIAPSISSPIPGMPHGKPAGVRCAQLASDNRCMIFGAPERPAVCGSLAPSEEMCGHTRGDALAILTMLEWETAPSAADAGHAVE